MKQALQQLYIRKKSTLVHYMCRHNHWHLFDLLKEHKGLVNINQLDSDGQSPLTIALTEKSSQVVEKVLREYKEQLDLSYTPSKENSDDQPPSLR